MVGVLFIIIKLIEYKPVIVRIPDNNGIIFNFVINNPVTIPAKSPKTNEASIPRYGIEFIVNTALIAVPKVKLPSTVKSGIFNTL